MAKKKPQKSINVTVDGNVNGPIIIGDQNSIATATALPRADTYAPPPFPSLDELPQPGQLPPGYRMPFHRNAVFTGREDDLKALAQTLVSPNSSLVTAITQTAAATGLGGIGKTQLAVEFCYRYGRYFHGVHWINAREGSLEAEIAACGREMGLPDFPETTPEQVALTLREWQKQPLRLVVLDNLEEPRVLSEWLPKLNGLRILVTARRQQWSADLGVEVHSLDTLPRPDSLALLRKLAPRLKAMPDTDLDPLAARLGDLPLALDLAGRYLHARPTLTIAEYLQRLNEQGNALEHTSLAGWVKDASPTAHETSLAATFLLSWQQLGNNEVDELAKRFFIAAGYLAPNIPIPRIIFQVLLLHDDWKENKPDKQEIEQLKEISDDALLHLQAIGLFAETLALHPLLAEFARAQETDNAILTALAEKMATLSYQANETGLPANFAPLRPHLAALVPAAERAGLPDSGTLWNSLGQHQKMVAAYPAARAAYERAVLICEKVYGKEHTFVATTSNNLGTLLLAMGDLPGAKMHFERALAIWEKQLGAEHLLMATGVNNLGEVLRNMGDLPGAKIHYERALAIWEKQLGVEHPQVATGVNNLGEVLRNMGDLPGAKIQLERALAIWEKQLGVEHPQVAFAVNNLGLVLQTIGDLPGAQTQLERALAIVEKQFGAEHPYVASSVNNLGLVLKKMGDLPGAKMYYERALAIREKQLGVEHPDVAQSVNDLGAVLQAMGDLPGAKIQLERALAIWEKQLGNEHPNVASAINNLGNVLQALGDLPGAKALYERALAIDEKNFGKEHPNIAVRLHNLATLLADMNDLPRALPLEQRALAMFQKFLPPEHPNVQNARKYLEWMENQAENKE